ncbi:MULTISPECIES: hypothetical protein [Bradyrhizobium]|uniref:hypothetical protein n=1 Tax=Bradyrhizobium TaxID=374 RepID=UPI0004277F8D|nr:MULTISPECIES: hypothetical protein [Bradyrhizobium]UFW51211.1 hypothetical protein BaraCB756_09390 [Bradyrhizobium arachidis]
MSDSFGSLVADCREEVEELLALSIASAARLEGVAKESGWNIRSIVGSITIFATV